MLIWIILFLLSFNIYTGFKIEVSFAFLKVEKSLGQNRNFVRGLRNATFLEHAYGTSLPHVSLYLKQTTYISCGWLHHALDLGLGRCRDDYYCYWYYKDEQPLGMAWAAKYLFCSHGVLFLVLCNSSASHIALESKLHAFDAEICAATTGHESSGRAHTQIVSAAAFLCSTTLPSHHGLFFSPWAFLLVCVFIPS